jgi:hypothetical protein
MLPLVLMLLVAQVPCAQGEFSVVCHCKQGRVSACDALRVTNPQLAKAIENALLAASRAEQAAKAEEAKAEGGQGRGGQRRGVSQRARAV